MPWYQLFIIGIYLTSMCLLFIYSMSQLHLTFAYLKANKKKIISTPPVNIYPYVTVQLPIYNEQYILERVIDKVVNLNYPADKLEIQILNDSTDESTAIITKKIDEQKEKGINIKHIKRARRDGFKAGALANGLKSAQGEFIAIFDADFLPENDFLLKTIPHFIKSTNIGVVQTRWGHINEKYSLLTRVQAFILNAHFSIEQTGRSYINSFINFNGTAGVWRKICIEDAGGWSGETLTEDLDLSYNAQLKGWKFIYLEEVATLAELPITMAAIKSQQFRWSKGAAETAIKNLRNVFNSSFSLQTKLHATFHLLNSFTFVVLLLGGVTSIPVLYIKYLNPSIKYYFHLGSVFFLGFSAMVFFFWVASKRAKYTLLRESFLPSFFISIAISMAFSFQNTRAVLEGVLGKKTPFIRTPKFNSTNDNAIIKHNKYLYHKIGANTIVELILGLYFLAGTMLGISTQNFDLILFHAMFALGFFTLSYQSIKWAHHVA